MRENSAALARAILLAGLLPIGWLAAETPEEAAAGTGDGGPRMIIVQPGYPGSTKDAAPYVRRLTSYLAEKVPVAGLTGVYFNVSPPALEAIRESLASGKGRFVFGIVSVGFYLENRIPLKLEALLETLPEGRYYLAAPGEPAAGNPPVSRPRDLSGKAVAGGALHEQKFLRREVFAGLEGIASWKAVPTLRITRALRRLERGRYQAAVLNERQYRSLEKLGRLKSLEIIHRSDYYPSAFFVRFRSAPGESESSADGSKARLAEELAVAKRAAEVLRRMADEPSGKKILETMGCDGFRSLRPSWLEKLEKRYHGEEN